MNIPRTLSALLLMPLVVFAGSLDSLAQSRLTLRSPWDEHPVKVTDAPYPSDIPEALPRDVSVSDYYSDSKHSVVDPARYAAYMGAEKLFRDTMKVTESAADHFQSTGSRAAAEAVLRILERNAEAKAMTGEMSSNQAYYLKGWTLGGLAIAWLKVRDAEPGSAAERELVGAWLKQLAISIVVYYDRGRSAGRSDARNNHYAWAGLAVMAAGIAANDRSYFDWGVGTYDDGVDQIQPDGTIPLEMSRGKRALHYHLFALAPLVMMAEFGAANGIDLYKRNKGALDRLVRLVVTGLENNSYFHEKAGSPQDTPDSGKIKSDDVIALIPYSRRFSSPAITRILQGVLIKPYGFLGGLPPR